MGANQRLNLTNKITFGIIGLIAVIIILGIIISQCGKKNEGVGVAEVNPVPPVIVTSDTGGPPPVDVPVTPGAGSSGSPGAAPPSPTGGTTTPPVPTQILKRLAVLYDVSKSIPQGLGNDLIRSAIEDSNEAISALCSPGGRLDPNKWKISRADYPNNNFDKIVLLKMGEPSEQQPYFNTQTVNLENLRNFLPSSPSDFNEDYTYGKLAKAVGIAAIEDANAEIYVLIISDSQDSKKTIPYNDNWADFSREELEGKYKNETLLVSAGWKSKSSLEIKLVKLERG
jgi:hypothetical protein